MNYHFAFILTVWFLFITSALLLGKMIQDTKKRKLSIATILLHWCELFILMILVAVTFYDKI